MKVVPELLCSDIEVTKKFYTEVLGFEVKYERQEEKFAYLTREGVDLMFEELAGPGRRWIAGDMELPYGRGMNLQWEVSDATRLYNRIRELNPECIYMEIETKSYECGGESIQQTQFLVQDPDGYLFRFCD